jgi:mycothiol synthase
MIRAVELKTGLIPDFVAYCKMYGHEQDESFLPDNSFLPGPDDPSFILVDNKKIIGAASLILHPEYREMKKGRFRIFHCIQKNKYNYSLLLESIMKCTEGINNIYCFIRDTNEEVREIWEDLSFEIERYSWVLSREIKDYESPLFPEGYYLENLKNDIDRQSFCDIINTAFAELAGHRNLSPEMFEEFKLEEGYLNDGFMLLWHKEKPIGTMQLLEEKENSKPVLYIHALGVQPEYQGKGLGKNLLRAALDFGKKNGYVSAVLSVNAENEGAANLYLKEGFKKTELYICYNKSL